MPSSLATVLLLTSGIHFLAHLCGFGTGRYGINRLETFLGSGLTCFATCRNVHLPITSCISYAHFTTYLLSASPTIHSVGHASLLRHSFTSHRGYRNICLFSIHYAFGLALVPTYPGRTNLPLESLGYRCVGFSPTSRYSHRHSHFHALHHSSRYGFHVHATLPYHLYLYKSAASVVCLAPVHFRRRVTRLVSLLRTL